MPTDSQSSPRDRSTRYPSEDQPLHVVGELPNQVREISDVWIPMPDGANLSASIWLPEDAENNPVPAILEYVPYRHRDLTASRDAMNHPYYAGHGYAGVRVDLRGSGQSDGILRDEYLEQELADGEEVLRWIAKQPWCNGSVGMIGISWGGFNGLQIAARQPPELKAIITLCSTDDRYADDVHYMGGCLLGDNLSWASVMFAYTSLPPDPQVVGDRWREMWLERLEACEPWLKTWLEHQHRDDFWKHGSICEDYSTIRCPVFAVSGWADGYSNAVFRLMERLEVPRKALLGPWSHRYPHQGVPGPAIGFLQEAVRWWDRWLKGIDTGIEDEPMIRAWMQESVPPTTRYDYRPGRWVGERAWPSPRIEERRYPLGLRRLGEPGEVFEEEAWTVESPLSVGLFAGKWCSYSATPDLPHDQREEDGGALTFESDPLEERLEMFGAPMLEVELAANNPVALIAARLSDVAPDDKATRITYGVLNLTHRDSDERPESLEPGTRYRVRIQLNEVAQVLPRGHRLRLSLSTSYWPLVWAPPGPARLTIWSGSSYLALPIRPPDPADERIAFQPPEGTPPLHRETVESSQHRWRVVRDLETDESTLEVVKDEGIYRLEKFDLDIEDRTYEWYRYIGHDFESAQGETFSVRGLRRGDWSIRTETRTILSSTLTHFNLYAELDAFENGRRIYSRNWDEDIPRNLV